MPCRNCGTEIADKAIICYRCGTPTVDAKYKPYEPPARRSRLPLVLLAAVVAVLVLVALFLLNSPP